MVSEAPKQSEAEVLKSELVGLFKHIQKIRVEIAMIKSPKTDHFTTMTDELDSVVDATSTATEDIMTNVERINDIAFMFSDKVTDAKDKEMVNEIIDRVTNVIVACSFQDITGQRIQKIVKAIKYIEGHINSLINIWGQDVINEQKVDKPVETDEYKKFLNGPQLKGQGVDQSQVDAMIGDLFPSSNAGQAKPAQPQVKLSQPSPQPAQPQVKLSQPSPQPTQPQVKLSQPSPQPTQPQVKLSQPSPQPAQPQVKLSQPSPQPTQPQVKLSQPSPQPAPKAKTPDPIEEEDKGPALDQNSIDALFD